MRVLDIFKTRHQFAYNAFYRNIFDRYTDDQLRTPVHPNTNPLLWILWHVARVEDSGVTRLVMNDEQVLFTDDWQARLGVDVTDFGFGRSKADVLEITNALDVSAVREYIDTVRAYVYSALERITPDQLDETVSREDLLTIMGDEGAALPHIAPRLAYMFNGWTRLEALYHCSVTHYYWHGGEVQTIESMIAS